MEINILNWINNNLHGSNIINYIVKYITYLGDAGILWLAIGLVLLCFSKTRKGGLIVLIGYCTAIAGNHFILKNIINRPRPFVGQDALISFIESINMELPSSSSFPSGHTFASMCSAIILTLSFGRKGAWSYIPATLISLSRVFLCVHYPSDVLAGAILGTISGVIVYFIANYFINKFMDNRKKKELLLTINQETVKEKEEVQQEPEEDEEEKDGENEDGEEKVPSPAEVFIEKNELN